MAAVGGGDEVLEVNVGGKVYTLLRATLCAEKGSVLAKMFDTDSPFGKITQDPQGRPFLDRNGDTFALVVEYLRNGCTLTEEEISELSTKDISKLQREADYFSLTSLAIATKTELDKRTKTTQSQQTSKTSKKEYKVLTTAQVWVSRASIL